MMDINFLMYIYLVEYVGLTPGYEREIFQRVQLGMTLTAAGKFVECFVRFLDKFSHFRSREIAGYFLSMG
jgi:hypothetical protein